MRLRHIPEHLTRVINSFLSDRKTSIKCGDFTNDQHLCDVGIPQSSPLLGLLYLFYNAPLVDLDGDPTFTVNLDSQGHADDINIAAMGKTTIGILPRLAKTKYIVFTRNMGKKDPTPLRYGGHEIQPQLRSPTWELSSMRSSAGMNMEPRQPQKIIRRSWHWRPSRAQLGGYHCYTSEDSMKRSRYRGWIMEP
ncbi:hypothetical protein FRC05_006854 [Tulasnella sp. 425]|nr:hypothetical protein FRC05_006854 [Tulasnella sp. 425]